MPELESRRFDGTIADQSGRVLGETRLWGTGERGPRGWWSGWLRVADLKGQVPPDRYIVTTPDGWRAEFQVEDRAPSRVFEADLLPITGIGPPPWPAAEEEADPPARRPPLVTTPWQGAQGIPPYKQQGDNPAGPVPRPAE